VKKPYPADENSFDRTAKPINIPNQFKNTDYGKKSKIVARKVQLKATDGSGKNYGTKTIMTKENAPTLIDFLISENQDLSALPDSVMGEIKSNIRKGAKDLQQQWKDALELVHKAYQVTLVRRPSPDQKGAWKQYMDLIGYGVSQLRATRGIDGKWRMSQTLVRESITEAEQLPSRRYFIEVPGNAPQEVEADNMDDIIDKMQNKLRSQGAKMRIERRDKYLAVVTVWVDDEMRERIVIKEL
jgi:hypothetical protein